MAWSYRNHHAKSTLDTRETGHLDGRMAGAGLGACHQHHKKIANVAGQKRMGKRPSWMWDSGTRYTKKETLLHGTTQGSEHSEKEKSVVDIKNYGRDGPEGQSMTVGTTMCDAGLLSCCQVFLISRQPTKVSMKKKEEKRSWKLGRRTVLIYRTKMVRARTLEISGLRAQLSSWPRPSRSGPLLPLLVDLEGAGGGWLRWLEGG